MKFGLVSVALALLVSVPTLAPAQSLKERMQSGLSQAKKGAEMVGQGAANVADRISDSVDSTVDLMTDEATPELTRAKLDAMAVETLARLFQDQPDALQLYDMSAGYAVFDTRKLALAGMTGGTGRGVAVSAEGDRTYMRMGMAGVSLSFGIGGFETQVIILFEDEPAFNEFVTTGYDATADAGSMFGEDTTSVGVHFVNGRALFFLTQQGWKISATTAGTKYWTDAALN